MRAALPEAAGLAPSVEEEYRCEVQRGQAGLSLAAGRVLREICESDLRLILSARVELVAVFAASVMPMFCLAAFYVLWPLLSTATEAVPRRQSAGRKEDYRDSRLSRFNNVTM
jgi:hypothetical protein